MFLGIIFKANIFTDELKFECLCKYYYERYVLVPAAIRVLSFSWKSLLSVFLSSLIPRVRTMVYPYGVFYWKRVSRVGRIIDGWVIVSQTFLTKVICILLWVLIHICLFLYRGNLAIFFIDERSFLSDFLLLKCFNLKIAGFLGTLSALMTWIFFFK